jgi:catechol 2,3-dioxygenase-like lactoylglutathione lyase family enzyme
MANFPQPSEGIALTHFIVSSNVERSRRFYADVLGGEVLLDGEPTIVALANSWIIINVGGGPTDDKPTVTLEPPQDPDRLSSFLNIRVADIHSAYTTSRGVSGATSWSVRNPGSGRGVVQEDLSDASGLLEGGEVPGVRKRDRSGAW